MKRAIVVALAMMTVACQTHTELGPCIGAFSDGDQGLVYEASVLNLVVGVFLWELIIPPVVVVAYETKCPVRRKEVRP